MPPKPSRSTNLPPGRGRAPAPWTIWEVMAIAVSVLMIVAPLTLEALNWIRPAVAPAQELMAATEPTISLEQRPPTFTPEPTGTASPTPDTTPTPTEPPGITPTPTEPPGITPTPTEPPGITPTARPTLTPSPTPGITRVNKFASQSVVAAGQNFSYSLAVTTQSAGTVAVTLSDTLPAEIELLEVSSTTGSCSAAGQTVTCTLSVTTVNPASITLQVQVRPTVASGTIISNQATITIDGSQIGVSNVVNVTVAGALPPTAQPASPTPVTPTPEPVVTVTPTPTTPVPTIGTTVPPITSTPVATVAPPPPTATRRPAPPPPPPPPPTEPPPAPTEPPVLPTEPPTPVPVATVAVRPTLPPPTRPPATRPPAPTNTPQITPSPTEEPAPAAFGESDLLLRLQSDWGSAYAGQDIVFTVVVGNTHPDQTVSAISLRSVMPSNLQVLSAAASRGADPVINGQTITYTTPDLAPGERLSVTIATRIRPTVSAGTLLVVQAQAISSTLSRPVFSNISTVLVVGDQQAGTATPTLAPVMSPTPSPLPTATVGATVSPAVTATPSPTATADVVLGSGAPTATPTPAIAGGQPETPAPLPDTSAGIPFLGILLLGATLLTRTIRLHRARERI